MQALLNVLIVLGMAVLVEYVAWLTHKHMMRGFLVGFARGSPPAQGRWAAEERPVHVRRAAA